MDDTWKKKHGIESQRQVNSGVFGDVENMDGFWADKIDRQANTDSTTGTLEPDVEDAAGL